MSASKKRKKNDGDNNEPSTLQVITLASTVSFVVDRFTELNDGLSEGELGDLLKLADSLATKVRESFESKKAVREAAATKAGLSYKGPNAITCIYCEDNMFEQGGGHGGACYGVIDGECNDGSPTNCSKKDLCNECRHSCESCKSESKLYCDDCLQKCGCCGKGICPCCLVAAVCCEEKRFCDDCVQICGWDHDSICIDCLTK